VAASHFLTLPDTSFPAAETMDTLNKSATSTARVFIRLLLLFERATRAPASGHNSGRVLESRQGTAGGCPPPAKSISAQGRPSPGGSTGAPTMSDIPIPFAIIAVVVILFVWDRIPVVLVALGTPLALYFAGILDLSETVAGLGDPAVIFIASLFVVSGALDASGVTAWAGQLLIQKAGQNQTRLLVLMMLLVALVTALISVNGAVAALLPVVVVTAIRLGRSTSQFLMPLVFAAHAGSMLAFTGTPVNVLVNEVAVNAGVAPFG